MRSSSLTKLKSLSSTVTLDKTKDKRDIKSSSSHNPATLNDRSTASKSPQKDKVKEVEIAVEQYLMEYHDSMPTAISRNHTDKYNNESKADCKVTNTSFDQSGRKSGSNDYKAGPAPITAGVAVASRSRTKSRSSSRVSTCSNNKLNHSRHQQQELISKLNDDDSNNDDDKDDSSFDDEIDSDELDDEDDDDDLERYCSNIGRSSNSEFSINDEMSDDSNDDEGCAEYVQDVEEESDLYLDSDFDSAASENKLKSAHNNNSSDYSTSLSVKELDKLYANCQVKIADLGNACWTHKHFTNDIQTRQVID